MRLFGYEVCNLVGFVFSSLCYDSRSVHQSQDSYSRSGFEVEYQWSYINFTWPTSPMYEQAILMSYIPENVFTTGIKYYNDVMFISLARIRPGIPVTLAYISTTTAAMTNPLLTPYPNWEMNVQQNNCNTLQNVQSMEVDRNGVMWVLDGIRINNFTDCPPKLLLLDLRSGGNVLHTYDFPNEICLQRGGFLNDIVIDEEDGGYAYITDNGQIDPGLIVYSLKLNKAWKLRDSSMFGEKEGSDFTVAGVRYQATIPIDGIALSPTITTVTGRNKLLFYCPVSSYNLYGIPSSVIKNQQSVSSGMWRTSVVFVGIKQGQSDGLAMDNLGNLYYGLLNLHAVGRWNLNENFVNSAITDIDPQTIIWPDTFAFDNNGHLYLVTNNAGKYFGNTTLTFDSSIKFRILKRYVGTNSYLYG